MKVAMIGAGYVGLVSAACFAEFGPTVVCVDADPWKIELLQRGKLPIYEPGLDALVARGVAGERLSFTTDLEAAVAGADLVFIAVGTPSRRGDGHADLRFVEAAALQIAGALHGYAVIVTKSTVPVGTGRKLQQLIAHARPNARFDVASNPEFLREGSAIHDCLNPDRVLVGVESERAAELLRTLYRPLLERSVPVVQTSLETAELTKYASNAFLATKITFVNELADLCERVGADVVDVARGMGLDGRIGSRFLDAGPGYGGSCFPKDTLALVRTAQEAGSPMRLVETVAQVNDTRKSSMASRVLAALDGHPRGRTVAVLGIAFKPETDDIRDAPSLSLVPALQDAGMLVRAHDPAAMVEARARLPDVVWCGDALEAAAGADVVVVMTEWRQYRDLDLGRLRRVVRTPIVVDLRNVYDRETAEAAGFTYVCIGRPARSGSNAPGARLARVG